MAGLSIAERSRLSLLLIRRGLRHAAGRARGHPLIRWKLSGRAERLAIAPQDLRTADGTRASEIYSGRFAFAGKVVICDGRSPFEFPPPSEEWAAALLGFGWLRHLRAAESGITRANARALVDEWISVQGAYHPIGWRPEVLSQRVYSWLSHAPLILHDADESFYRRFLRSLARQVRYLRHTIVDTPEGIPRLHALVALTYAALSMSGQHRHLRNTIKQLVAEVEAQILPDGGHISRNPGALIEALADLLPLRQAFAACNVTPPEAINHAIDRMMPMLRFFRHGDGNFAHFNGMGRTPNDLVASILAYDDARGAPLSGAPHAGYQRLQINDTVVLMDTGAPPPLRVSREAHAGCLSFEMSSGSQRIVVNCGLPPVGRDNWRQIARATAAHSTVTLNDTSSCHILEGSVFRNVIGSPIVGGPKSVPVERDETDGAVAVLASHDGYANRYGVIHHRALRLSEDGHRLDGEDAFIPAKGDLLPQNRPDAFALRFHLHPSVKASRLTDGRGVMLVLPNREAWTFNAYEDRVELEESIYLSAPEGSRRTQQIVIAGRARKIPRIHWSFVHISPATNGKAVERSEEPELPL